VLSRFVFSDPRALRFNFYQLWFVVALVAVMFFEMRKSCWLLWTRWVLTIMMTVLLINTHLFELDEHYQRYIKVTKANLAYYVGSDTAYRSHIVNIFEVKAKVNALTQYRDFLTLHEVGPFSQYSSFDWNQVPQTSQQPDATCKIKKMQLKRWDNQVVELRGVLLQKPETMEGASWIVLNHQNKPLGLGIIFDDQDILSSLRILLGREKDSSLQHRWAIFFRGELPEDKLVKLWLKSPEGNFICGMDVTLEDVSEFD